MQRAEMVRQGARQLVVAENAIDIALCEVASLANELVRMRMDSKLSAVVGQDVIDGIAASYQRLSKARRSMVKVHGDLDEVKTLIGCRTVAVGTDNDKPDPGNTTGRHIHVVGDERAA